MKSILPIVLGLLVLAAIFGAFKQEESVEPESTVASVGTVVTDEVPPAPDTPTPTAAAPPPTLDLAAFAHRCFNQVRERNPRGRVLRLSANRLAGRCSGVVETRPGSGRWVFDWNDGNSWVRKGEVKQPESWPPLGAEAAIPDAQFTATEISARVAAAHERVGEAPHDEWMYDINWFPEPFSRPIVAITLSDTAPDAEQYGGYTTWFDSGYVVDGNAEVQANELYPMTRFELREDHSFKGALYESMALAEAAFSLETDPSAAADPPLVKGAESCMEWLHKINTGSRVLRVAITPTHCYIALENGAQRDDFYLFTSRGGDAFTDSPSLQIDVAKLPNLMLDRSRVTMPRLRERLAQTQAQPGGKEIDRLAVFWLDDERMVWQFSAGPRVVAHLDEAGGITPAPAQFPITRAEIDGGFPASSPVMEVLVER